MFSIDTYTALRTTGAVVRRTDRGVLSVTGADRATWLQGLVTNDVLALAEGQSCYAAYLTPQGRMITDMNILARADRLLLDVPRSLAASLRERLDSLVFAEEVQVADVSETMQVVELYVESGIPRSIAIVPQADPLSGDLANYPEANLETLEVFRIERGVPKFLVDMNEDTIPLEAGIEDRAISFTKGCYVGQEIIVRVTHRGGGRVAKRLVPLRWASWSYDDGGTQFRGNLFAGDREVGRVTSAAFSPGEDSVLGLGYVHRDFVEPGTELTAVWDDARHSVMVA